ncbi:hypothetical protein N7449_011668 [Penicillium cf. viridicatum]|uniref:Uncharacterized protein n=1 Tax=Penicillium cf. viridicatum TaxID=2972119 RepID=A0A9W9IQG7_9EURO|nr:hypothetical protein N7449_011668 [Penicillium cf. viridicatum]
MIIVASPLRLKSQPHLRQEIITLIRSDIESKARPATHLSSFPYHGISHAHLQLRIRRPNNASTRTPHRSQLVICHATSVTEYEVRPHQLCINNVLDDFRLGGLVRNY